MIPTDWPRAARVISKATIDAVAAVRVRSSDGYVDAVTTLEAEDPSQVGSVHAEIVRSLMEELHPDGLTGEDVQDALTRTARSAAEWMPTLDVDGFVEVLTGALGVADTDAERPRPRVGHAVLIVADLLGLRRASAEVYVRRALAEIERAQTVEMP